MPKSTIYFHTEEIDFELGYPKKITNWIYHVISNEKKLVGDINFIFCSDEYLHKINLTYLNHDNYTDIITFNYNANNLISGDLFISIDRVKENAVNYPCAFEDEIKRVMVHGILHLIGYNDKTTEEALLMRAKEDFYLTLYFKLK